MKTFPEVLIFMDLSSDTEISRGRIIQSVNAFVKTEKTAKNPDIIVEGNNRAFKLIGKLLTLFKFIKTEMVKRGDMKETDPLPEFLLYTQIMKYLKYCFPVKV